MTESALLEQILDRLGRAASGDAIFGTDEAADWPSGARDILSKAGLLKRTQPARSVECKGCERNCVMPVQVRPADGNRIGRAFISCDKRDDIGRVPVELRRLTQWRITAGGLAETLAGLLGFAKPAQDGDGSGKRWKLGLLKGDEHKGEIKLALGDGITLMVSGHCIPVADVVTLDGTGLSIDREELRRLVDKPAGEPGAQRYASNIAGRETRKLNTQKVYQAWQKAYRELKRTRKNMSDVWYSQQIAKGETANGRDAETIRKHMRK